MNDYVCCQLTSPLYLFNWKAQHISDLAGKAACRFSRKTKATLHCSNTHSRRNWIFHEERNHALIIRAASLFDSKKANSVEPISTKRSIMPTLTQDVCAFYHTLFTRYLHIKNSSSIGRTTKILINLTRKNSSNLELTFHVGPDGDGIVFSY